VDSYNFTLQDLKKQNARLMIQLRSLKAQIEGGGDIVKGGGGPGGDQSVAKNSRLLLRSSRCRLHDIATQCNTVQRIATH